MKRTVLVFGLISGVIIGVFLIAIATLCENSSHNVGSWVTGYGAQILAFSLVFVGVKSFRDKHNQGVVSFGKALRIGLGIMLIASTMYVLVWLVDYYLFIPDFMDKYAAHALQEIKEGGASQAVIAEKTTQMASMQALYKNPFFVVLFTYLEVLPVGIVISLVTALILKRKTAQP